MNFLKKILKFGIYAVVVLKTFAFNIGIAPTGFYMNLNKNETQEIMVSNNTFKPMRIEIEAVPDEEWKDYSMDEWIKIYPKTITLKPQGTRNVRFSVRKPDNVPDGEYKAGILFKELPEKPSEVEKVQNTADAALDFVLLTEIEISAYGLKGKRDVTGKLINASVVRNKDSDMKTLMASFEAKGNSSLAVIGEIEYLDAGKKVLKKTEDRIGMTARNTTSKLSLSLKDIPQNSKYVRVSFKDKSGLKLGNKEISL